MEKNQKNEYRFVEFRAVDNDENKMIIEGYAITYDKPATHKYGLRKFTEVIKRGALDNTEMKDVPLRYNHTDTYPLMASTRNNSLTLIKDEVGLKIRAELIDTNSNRDIYKLIQEGLVNKMSFAFSVADKGATWQYGDNETIRTVTSIEKLYDVSVVDSPFYDSTSVHTRSSLETAIKEIEDFELRKKKLKLKYSNLEEEI
ncbi:MAG: HK97 family phage prohead protease [Clostridium sp.]|nr:HK97 family phage prohead protease [Clostridium sp.]